MRDERYDDEEEAQEVAFYKGIEKGWSVATKEGEDAVMVCPKCKDIII